MVLGLALIANFVVITKEISQIVYHFFIGYMFKLETLVLQVVKEQIYSQVQ